MKQNVTGPTKNLSLLNKESPNEKYFAPSFSIGFYPKLQATSIDCFIIE